MEIKLGLLITGNLVSVEHNIKDHLITTENGNPKISQVSTNNGNIEVFSIFTRLKNNAKFRRNRHEKKLGDNCPLIYALKNKDGLKTNISSIKELTRVGYEILKKNFKIDSKTVIVCAPSGHSLVKILASRIGKQYNVPVHFDIFLKSSKEDAILKIEKAMKTVGSYLERKELENLKEKLNRSSGLSMKDIPTKHRHIIQPLVLNKRLKFDNVIIVDDLIATGTTFVSAKNLLTSNRCCSNVRGLSLFSDV